MTLGIPLLQSPSLAVSQLLGQRQRAAAARLDIHAALPAHHHCHHCLALASYPYVKTGLRDEVQGIPPKIIT